jgi:hypothetical protein
VAGARVHRAERLKLSDAYAEFDAELRWSMPGVRVADPKACQCGEVLKGVLKPWECKVFGTACTPETRSAPAWCRRRARARPTTTSGGCTVTPRSSSAGLSSGAALFARYADAPNALGYCGPRRGSARPRPRSGIGAAVLRRLALPEVLARLTGTADPLDSRLVEAYWLGRDLGVDREASAGSCWPCSGRRRARTGRT